MSSSLLSERKLWAAAAALTFIYILSVEPVFAGEEEKLPSEIKESPSITMLTNANSPFTRERRSVEGVVEPVGVPRGVFTPIRVQVPSNLIGQSVTVGLLDGGKVLGAENLSVAGDGSIDFSFKPGAIKGLHRVMVVIGPEQYMLQLHGVE